MLRISVLLSIMEAINDHQRVLFLQGLCQMLLALKDKVCFSYHVLLMCNLFVCVSLIVWLISQVCDEDKRDNLHQWAYECAFLHIYIGEHVKEGEGDYSMHVCFSSHWISWVHICVVKHEEEGLEEDSKGCNMGIFVFLPRRSCTIVYGAPSEKQMSQDGAEHLNDILGGWCCNIQQEEAREEVTN